MQNIAAILSLAGTAACFLAGAITLLTRLIKTAKEKKQALNINKICNAVVPFITQAESFRNYSGQEKREFVLTKANQFAIDNGIKFDAGLVEEKIEELVRLSKEVNMREKDRYNNSINQGIHMHVHH